MQRAAGSVVATGTARKVRSVKSRRIPLGPTDEITERLEQAVVLTGHNQTDHTIEVIADKADTGMRVKRILDLTDREVDALLENDMPPRDARRRELGVPS